MPNRLHAEPGYKSATTIEDKVCGLLRRRTMIIVEQREQLLVQRRRAAEQLDAARQRLDWAVDEYHQSADTALSELRRIDLGNAE